MPRCDTGTRPKYCIGLLLYVEIAYCRYVVVLSGAVKYE